MIRITVYRSQDLYKGFCSQGHAGYAEEGYDIICSAVSALTVNTVNSVEEFTDDRMDVACDDGYLELKLSGELSSEGQLLMKSLVLGIQAIQNNYGNEYIELEFKEV